MALYNAKAPRLIGKARNEIDLEVHGKIDSVLKDLRACSRRLAGAASAVNDELRILHRLYYKGKNQHRSALFWRRVAEVRRFAQCISQVQLSNFVDRLRYAFYGDIVQNE